MPLLTQQQIIKEYYEQVKYKHPNTTLEEFIKMCETPVKYTRFCMRQPDAPIILLKYFGRFIPMPKRIKKQMSLIRGRFIKGFITEDDFNSLMREKEEQLKNSTEFFKRKQDNRNDPGSILEIVE